jgi:acetyl-CoA C-acetyltransferase
MRDVAVTGIAQTDHARRRDDASFEELVFEVSNGAVNHAGLTTEDIDAVIIASGPTYFTGVNHPEKWLLEAAGGAGKPVHRITAGGATGAYGAVAAYHHVISGQYDNVLAVAYDKMSEGETQYAISTLYDPNFGRDFAVGIMTNAATLATARMAAYDYTPEQAAQVVVKNRKHGMANPHAHQAGEYTIEDVIESPPVVEPFHLHDCPPVSDGACAMVLSGGDEAESLRDNPAWVQAAETCTEGYNSGDRELHPPVSAKLAAERAYDHAEITNPLRQLDVAEIYESYSYEEMMIYERLGLCGEGEGGRLVEEGVTQLDGELPVNPSGGVLCANPIGATAMIRMAEAALQVMGEAGDRQLPDVAQSLGHAYGGWDNHHSVMIFGDDR